MNKRKLQDLDTGLRDILLDDSLNLSDVQKMQLAYALDVLGEILERYS
jgi:hypothetical protein